MAALERREAIVSGLPFFEVVSVTRLDGGDRRQRRAGSRPSRRSIFAIHPDRTPDDAEVVLRALVPTDATVEVVGNSPPGAVSVDVPLVQALRSTGNFPIEPKQAWTNVADFTSRGIHAVNFGPGATRFAHAFDERVEIGSLVRAYEALRRVVLG